MIPWTAVPQAPLSVGFSRREYWRGLPCPSPWNLINPGIKPRYPALWAYSFTDCRHILCLSLLQRIFPTQELNQGLLHWRRILYQQSYHGSPTKSIHHNYWAHAPKSQFSTIREAPVMRSPCTTARKKPCSIQVEKVSTQQWMKPWNSQN